MVKALKFLLILVFICIIFILYLQLANHETADAIVIFQTNDKAMSFHCDVADNPLSRQKGLLGITYLENNDGMIFVYEDAAIRTFTMKDMLIPLDIIFINENHTVIHIVEADIGQEHISSKGKAQYVVEINKGLSALHQIAIGTKIKLILNN